MYSLYEKLPDELWMLAVSFLPLRTILPRLPSVGRRFSDVVWGRGAGALMWRETGNLDALVFKLWPWPSDADAATVLIRACAQRAPRDHIDTLLVGGANVHAVDNCGMTALYYASHRGHIDIARTLLDANADPNVVNNDRLTRSGWTPLIVACTNGHSAMASTLLEYGANIDHADKYMWTALMQASVNDNADVVRVLIANGANTHAQNSNGKTALDIARSYFHHNIVSLLFWGAMKQ